MGYLTEKKAWKYLRNRWVEALDVLNCSRNEGAYINSREKFGLCMCIVYLNCTSKKTKDSMLGKIEAEFKRRKKDSQDYLWSFTKAGLKARIRFCEKCMKGD